MKKLLIAPLVTALLLSLTAAHGEEEAKKAPDAINVKQISMELATDIAREAVLACREKGYNVAAAVVDRSASVQALLRDTMANRFTLQVAEEKANAVIMSGVSSADFRTNRADIKDEMNEVDGIMVLDGGLKIESGGSLLGAVGVSGAPGGDKDAECAQAALDKLAERLEFME
ncbi:MAG: heme-binding protein [Gammaproteobacteria bacterium]|nr:heme-binding protein [Gammaproteobacteria bacterium]MBU1724036.1 heme-binding protein [Gammaproteobacteria bacterium]MBU2006895.1 heme-binding protein [Gammaproteobacteria bacterium]